MSDIKGGILRQSPFAKQHRLSLQLRTCRVDVAIQRCLCINAPSVLATFGNPIPNPVAYTVLNLSRLFLKSRKSCLALSSVLGTDPGGSIFSRPFSPSLFPSGTVLLAASLGPAHSPTPRTPRPGTHVSEGYLPHLTHDQQMVTVSYDPRQTASRGIALTIIRERHPGW